MYVNTHSVYVTFVRHDLKDSHHRFLSMDFSTIFHSEFVVMFKTCHHTTFKLQVTAIKRKANQAYRFHTASRYYLHFKKILNDHVAPLPILSHKFVHAPCCCQLQEIQIYEVVVAFKCMPFMYLMKIRPTFSS